MWAFIQSLEDAAALSFPLDARQAETRLFETRRRKMTFIKHILVITSLLLMRPCLAVAQEQRPAIIPLAQGGGSSSAASASSGASMGGLSDGPIAPGEVVHINVFDAPDFSLITRVSETGDVPFRFLIDAKLWEKRHSSQRGDQQD
jgi:hypothetical protein